MQNSFMPYIIIVVGTIVDTLTSWAFPMSLGNRRPTSCAHNVPDDAFEEEKMVISMSILPFVTQN